MLSIYDKTDARHWDNYESRFASERMTNRRLINENIYNSEYFIILNYKTTLF